MRRCSILCLLAVMALPSFAAKRVSVAQLEHTLSTMADAHQTDDETAIQIGTLEPAERVSNATLERLTKLYVRGSQTSVALQLLADRSSFLELPSGEIPSIPPSDKQTQQKLLEIARIRAHQALPQLPNMFATRTTFSFNDSPRLVKKGAWPVKAGLHLVDISKTEVNVQSERENIAVGTLPASHQPNGLTTWGEFGLALLMVLDDSAKGITTWSHWEQFPHGPVAVFDYSVPKSASHYEIAMPAEHITHIDGSDRWIGATVRATGGYTGGGTAITNRMAHETPGYKGSLWIDPASGTILRITLIAEVQGNANLNRAETLVEYGPVQIGNKSFVCPIRSFALSSAPSNPTTTINGGTTEWLNENLFSDYHLFATTSRIVGPPPAAPGPATASEEANGTPRADAGRPPERPATSPIPKIQTAEITAAVPPPGSVDQLSAVASPQLTPAVSAQPSAVAPTAPQPPSVLPSIAAEEQPAPNVSSVTVPSPPVVPPEMSNPGNGLTLHVNADAVLVPVVVRDEHGKSIDNLQQQDFEVFDNGKPRPLSGFLVEKHDLPARAEHSAAPPEGAAQTIAATQSVALPQRTTVFVFDDLHLTAAEIAYSQKAAIETLDEALAGSDLSAVVTISGKINSGLTRDRTILTNAITAVRPQLLYRPDAAECPKLSYYQADLIANKRDSAAMADAVQQVVLVCSPVQDRNIPRNMNPSSAGIAGTTNGNDSDPIIGAAQSSVESAARLILQRANRDLLATAATIGEFIKKMARLPGQRTLILISPGFPPVDPAAREAESKLINIAAQSGVTIDALNARGLDTTAIQSEDDTKKIRNPTLMAEYREREMQGEEDTIWHLADGTGGKFFHNNNDLAAGFRLLMQAPETVYLLELPLEGIRPDGTWHRLSVKTSRTGAHLQARQGYFAPSKGATRKQDTNGRN
jgi:VWFA-related protein